MSLAFAVVTGGCSRSAAPDSTHSSSATSSISSSSAGNSEIAPPPGSASAETVTPLSEPWPPVLVLTSIKEAGTTDVAFGMVSFQIPAGATVISKTDTSASYSLTSPGTSAVGAVTISTEPTQGRSSLMVLQAVTPSLSRTTAVTIPSAVDAGVGEGPSSKDKVLVLAISTPDKQTVVATFQAPKSSFDELLLFQSLCSVKVTK